MERLHEGWLDIGPVVEGFRPTFDKREQQLILAIQQQKEIPSSRIWQLVSAPADEKVRNWMKYMETDYWAYLDMENETDRLKFIPRMHKSHHFGTVKFQSFVPN